MILYIIKPRKGYGFAAILCPGFVDGESGMNENCFTVSQNNIGIKQTEWNIMPVSQLSRYMLQYSGTTDLDFWIAVPPDSRFRPTSYGPYIGFNLRHELYGTGGEPNPKSFPVQVFSNPKTRV